MPSLFKHNARPLGLSGSLGYGNTLANSPLIIWPHIAYDSSFAQPIWLTRRLLHPNQLPFHLPLYQLVLNQFQHLPTQTSYHLFVWSWHYITMHITCLTWTMLLTNSLHKFNISHTDNQSHNLLPLECSSSQCSWILPIFIVQSIQTLLIQVPRHSAYGQSLWASRSGIHLRRYSITM